MLSSKETKEKAEVHLAATENNQTEGNQHKTNLNESRQNECNQTEINQTNNNQALLTHLEKGRQEVIQLIKIDNPEINNPTLQDILDYRQGTILIRASGDRSYLIDAVRYLLTMPAILALIDKKIESTAKVIIKKNGTEKKIFTRSQTALTQATWQGYWTIVYELLKARASYRSLLRIPNILMRAIRQESLFGVRCLLRIPEIRKTINMPDNDGTTPILLAALKNQWEMVKRLQKAGATLTSLIEYREPRSHNTILMNAAQKGAKEGVDYCLNIPELLLLLNTENRYSQTALFLAIYSAKEYCVDALLKAQKTEFDAKEALTKALNYHFGDLSILMLALESFKLKTFKCFSKPSKCVQFILSLRRDKTFLEMENQLGQTALVQAAFQGSLQTVIELINAGASIETLLNYRDHDGNTILIWCSIKKYNELFEYLLNIISDTKRFNPKTINQLVHWENNFDASAIIHFILNGSLEIIRLLMPFYSSIKEILQYRDPDGCNILHTLAKYDDLEIAEYFSQFKGFTKLISIGNNQNQTPFFYATLHGCYEMVQFCTQRGSSKNELINWRDQDLNTILMIAAGLSNPTGLRYILTPIGTENYSKENPSESIYLFNFAEIRHLISLRNIFGQSAFFHATFSTNYYNEEILCTHEVLITQKDKLEDKEISKRKHECFLKEVVNFRSNYNPSTIKKGGTLSSDTSNNYRLNVQDQTFLMYAICSLTTKQLEERFWRYMLRPEIRDSIKVVNECGETAITVAIRYAQQPIVGILRNHGATLKDVISQRYTDNNTVLNRLIAFGTDDAVKCLLSFRESHILIHESNDQGNTPLGFAASLVKPNIILVLLSNGANIEHLNKYNKTILELVDLKSQNRQDLQKTIRILVAAEELMRLCRGELNTRLLKPLLDEGASVRQVDNKKRTPLHLTTCKKISDLTARKYLNNLAMQLLKNGADPFTLDDSNLSPIDYIIRHSNIALLSPANNAIGHSNIELLISIFLHLANKELKEKRKSNTQVQTILKNHNAANYLDRLFNYTKDLSDWNCKEMVYLALLHELKKDIWRKVNETQSISFKLAQIFRSEVHQFEVEPTSIFKYSLICALKAGLSLAARNLRKDILSKLFTERLLNEDFDPLVKKDVEQFIQKFKKLVQNRNELKDENTRLHIKYFKLTGTDNEISSATTDITYNSNEQTAIISEHDLESTTEHNLESRTEHELKSTTEYQELSIVTTQTISIPENSLSPVGSGSSFGSLLFNAGSESYELTTSDSERSKDQATYLSVIRQRLQKKRELVLNLDLLMDNADPREKEILSPFIERVKSLHQEFSKEQLQGNEIDLTHFNPQDVDHLMVFIHEREKILKQIEDLQQENSSLRETIARIEGKSSLSPGTSFNLTPVMSLHVSTTLPLSEIQEQDENFVPESPTNKSSTNILNG